jgi:superfamily II helicase
MHPRIQREQKTIDIMIDLYCRNNHASKEDLCDECSALKEYSHLRLEKCPYQENKTTCANCPTHCYQKTMREKIRMVMRYAGPRMLIRHPWLAILHLFDGFRKPVSLKEIREKNKAEHHN